HRPRNSVRKVFRLAGTVISSPSDVSLKDALGRVGATRVLVPFRNDLWLSGRRSSTPRRDALFVRRSAPTTGWAARERRRSLGPPLELHEPRDILKLARTAVHVAVAVRVEAPLEQNVLAVSVATDVHRKFLGAP